ncbi:hypothetical protein BGW80DRAFT_1253909 [Lactifluus volemus]|nr:hypothetical protein BGW80DRAFT_1253909 [Lactifluus volemus]
MFPNFRRARFRPSITASFVACDNSHGHPPPLIPRPWKGMEGSGEIRRGNIWTRQGTGADVEAAWLEVELQRRWDARAHPHLLGLLLKARRLISPPHPSRSKSSARCFSAHDTILSRAQDGGRARLMKTRTPDNSESGSTVMACDDDDEESVTAI